MNFESAKTWLNIQTHLFSPVRLPNAAGLIYAGSIIEKLWMFMIKIPRIAKPRRTSSDKMRSEGGIGVL